MNLTFPCPHCRVTGRWTCPAGRDALVCSSCAQQVPLRTNAWEENRLVRCALCGTEAMYVQKDFPHRLGLTIVLVGFLLSTVAWYFYWYPIALGILLATAALDLCLYYAVGDVTVCYRCLVQYRGTERNPSHRAFDLAVGERYRQERIRLESIRKQTGS